MQRMDDFKTLVASVRKKKGRMDAIERQKGAELIAAMLNDPEQDTKEMLVLAEEIQSEAVADGIGLAWPQMPAERRVQVRRWIPAAQTERAQRRVALLATKLAETDGATALELLDGLIPDHRPNKELKQLIINSLFADGRVIQFDNLAKASVLPRVSSRVFTALAALAFEATSGIEHMPRYLLSLAIVSFVASQNLVRNTDGADLLSKVVIEVERWPRGLRDQFEGWLKNTQPELLPEFFPLTRSSTPRRDPEKTAEVQFGPAKDIPVAETAKATVDQYLEGRANSLAAELELLSRVRTSLAENQNEQQRQIDARKSRESELNNRVAELRAFCTSLEETLASTTDRIKQLEQELQIERREKETEHEKLTRQIAANAHGRVSEFQNQVALTLARYMVDLPSKETVVSPELGRVLLLQFHQLIDVLNELGIKLPNGRGVRQ